MKESRHVRRHSVPDEFVEFTPEERVTHLVEVVMDLFHQFERTRRRFEYTIEEFCYLDHLADDVAQSLRRLVRAYQLTGRRFRHAEETEWLEWAAEHAQQAAEVVAPAPIAPDLGLRCICGQTAGAFVAECCASGASANGDANADDVLTPDEERDLEHLEAVLTREHVIFLAQYRAERR